MPFQPDQREYRSFFSSFQAVEPQEGESPDGFVVEGYATTFDVPYEFGPPGYSERVDSRALEGADMSDVIFQIDHSGSPLARLRNRRARRLRALPLPGARPRARPPVRPHRTTDGSTTSGRARRPSSE